MPPQYAENALLQYFYNTALTAYVILLFHLQSSSLLLWCLNYATLKLLPGSLSVPLWI